MRKGWDFDTHEWTSDTSPGTSGSLLKGFHTWPGCMYSQTVCKKDFEGCPCDVSLLTSSNHEVVFKPV